MTAFWDVSPCSLIEIFRRFIGVYWLHRQSDDRLIAMITKAVITSETSDETTRRNIQETVILKEVEICY
jgi:hypothetical protein